MIELKPQPGKQTDFFKSQADILIYGGGAGGGKTWSLIVEPLRNIHIKGFNAVIFRRTYAQIRQAGGLWSLVEEIYPYFGGTPSGSSWYFNKNGYKTEIRFSHIQHEKDKQNYQGAEIPLICFDELTHFSESQFFYLLTRNRSTCGVKPYVRATTNPDPNSWVKKFIQWWIDEDTGLPIEERSGEIRYFYRDGESYTWGDSIDEVMKLNSKANHNDIKSLSFISARLEDNKILQEKDPSYRASLISQDSYTRELLLNGNWNVKPITGDIFKNPKFDEWIESDYSIGHIDPAYSGKNTTALTILAKLNDGYFQARGKVWRKNVVDCYYDILEELNRYKVGTLYVESNKDGTLSSAKTLSKLRNGNVKPYHENLNKHIKIMQFGYKNWDKIIFPYDIDKEYLNQILDYTEGIEPDDCPDSLASSIRIMTAQRTKQRVNYYDI